MRYLEKITDPLKCLLPNFSKIINFLLAHLSIPDQIARPIILSINLIHNLFIVIFFSFLAKMLKKKAAPLMQKTLQLFKGLKR